MSSKFRGIGLVLVIISTAVPAAADDTAVYSQSANAYRAAVWGCVGKFRWNESMSTWEYNPPQNIFWKQSLSCQDPRLFIKNNGQVGLDPSHFAMCQWVMKYCEFSVTVPEREVPIAPAVFQQSAKELTDRLTRLMEEHKAEFASLHSDVDKRYAQLICQLVQISGGDLQKLPDCKTLLPAADSSKPDTK